jgi:hypothetical protein
MAYDKTTYSRYLGCQVYRETANAVLLNFDGVKFWVPKSNYKNNENGIYIADWFINVITPQTKNHVSKYKG